MGQCGARVTSIRRVASRDARDVVRATAGRPAGLDRHRGRLSTPERAVAFSAARLIQSAFEVAALDGHELPPGQSVILLRSSAANVLAGAGTRASAATTASRWAPLDHGTSIHDDLLAVLDAVEIESAGPLCDPRREAGVPGGRATCTVGPRRTGRPRRHLRPWLSTSTSASTLRPSPRSVVVARRGCSPAGIWSAALSAVNATGGAAGSQGGPIRQRRGGRPRRGGARDFAFWAPAAAVRGPDGGIRPGGGVAASGSTRELRA